ncbi:MAG: mitomycin antibiotics/polyketide fumonisin biosynthesis protein [Gemmatimonadetes bacterium]|nr:mitomycin antibiotics/polyketide fumonisin biosynthesis protein [Gemmatimonadota bacterium]MBT7864681.1 mitomycin antibiotics/polyketide fumonisin biosynthesis protein [Gemmatimonadota bacterium]
MSSVYDPELIQQWVRQFHRDGYLFIESVLDADTVATLRTDLDTVLEQNPPKPGSVIELQPRMFETSPANLSLFDLEPIVSFAEALIDPTCHVIHNNSFRTPTGGGLITWHQDDASHYVVTHGERPTNVHLPVLLFTANYYLTDVEAVENGPTQVIPGSHLSGGAPPGSLDGTEYEDQIASCLGPAGSVVMFNNQVWHRGGPNTSDRVRYMTQISYARRIIGHKYFPFMNYEMPEHVHGNADERLKRLLGFLPSGAYG